MGATMADNSAQQVGHLRERASAAWTSRLATTASAAFLLLAGFAAGAYAYRHSLWPLQHGSPFRPGEHDDFSTYDADRKWALRLRDGGYILYIRHAQREKWIDVTAFDAIELISETRAETSTFRRAVCLTEQGVEEAKIIGEVFRRAGVVVEEIVASPSCRARQTAMHAFGRIDKISSALLHRTAIMKEQHRDFALQTRKIIDALAPSPGKNAVIVAHAGTMRYDGKIMIDVDETGGKPDDRDETGFIVMEKSGGKIIARHKFRSIKNLAFASIELPVDSAGAAGPDADTATAAQP